MTYTNVKPVYNLRERADYLEHGVGAKKRGHMAAGTNRLAVMYCDLGSIEEFIARGEQLAARHSRRVQAYSYIQSFPSDEFDLSNPGDLQRVNDLGFLWAKKMHPDTDTLIVTHSDGSCAHNHVIELNHDNVTGKALTRYRTFYQAVQANNELMAEQGERWQKLPTATQQRTQDTYWASTRGELGGFDQLLGDRVQAALDDPASTDMDSFGEQCGGRGVQVQVTVRNDVTGVTYRMRDDDSGRVRRRKASNLSPSFTAAALATTFEAKQGAVPTLPPKPVILQGGTGLFASLPSSLAMMMAGYTEAEVEAALAAHEASQAPRAPEPSRAKPVTEPATTAAASVEVAATQRPPASAEAAQRPHGASEDPIHTAQAGATHVQPTDAEAPPEEEKEEDQPERPDVLAAPRDAPPAPVVEPEPEAEVEQNEPVAVTTPKRETVSERIAREDAEGQARHDARLAKLPPELRRKIQELETPPSFGDDRSL